MKKGIIIIVLLVLVGLIGNACEADDDSGAYMDWGEGYYWNSQTNSVEKTLW